MEAIMLFVLVISALGGLAVASLAWGADSRDVQPHGR